MVAIFEELAPSSESSGLWQFFAERPVPPRVAPEPHNELEVPVIPVRSEAPELSRLVKDWGSDLDDEARSRAHDFAVSVLQVLHDLEVERASRPPVLNVTVTLPEGSKVPAGEFQVRTGDHPVVAFRPSAVTLTADTSVDAIPAYRDPAPRRRTLTRLFARAKG